MNLMKRALIIFGAWTAVALLFAIQMHFQTTSGTQPRSWGWILAWQLTGWWCWALFTAPVCAFAAWAVRIRRPVAVVAAHVPMAVLFAVAVAGATLCLIVAGGLVTSTESGLSVPDWPTTYGQNMFTFPVSKWVGGIKFEHSHRLIASTGGFLTVVLAAWLAG